MSHVPPEKPGKSPELPRNDRETVRSILVPSLPFPKEIASLLLAHEHPVDVSLLGKISEDQVDEGAEKQHTIYVSVPHADQEMVKERVEKLEKVEGTEKWVPVYERTNYFVRVNGKLLQKATIDVLSGTRKQIRTNDYDGLGRKFSEQNVIDGVKRSHANTEYDGESENVTGYVQDFYDPKGVLLERIAFKVSGILPALESTAVIYKVENGEFIAIKQSVLKKGAELSQMFQQFFEQELWPRQDEIVADSPLKDSYCPLVNQLRQGY